MTLEPHDYLSKQAELVAPRAPGLVTALRAIDAGRATPDWYGRLPQQDWRFPPAFLPMLHVEAAVVYGAWISDPLSGEIDVIALHPDRPKPTATALGRTGLRVLLRMLADVSVDEADELEEAEDAEDEVELRKAGTTRAFVDLVFPDADADAREALADAALSGFDPAVDAELRVLPIVGEVWSDRDDVPPHGHAEPLAAMVARNVYPVDRSPSPSRRPAFDAAMRAGDHRRAWAELNDSGWTYDECVKAFEELAPHIDPEIAELVRAKLDREVFGPTSGY